MNVEMRPPALPQFLLVLALCLLAACEFQTGSETKGKDEAKKGPKKLEAVLVRLESPTRDALSDRLEVTARVLSFSRATIFPRTDGVVTELVKREGEAVQKGDLLARLVNEMQTIDRDGKKVALEQSRLATIQARHALDEAKAQLRGETVTLTNEEVKLARAKDQHQKSIIADQDLEAAQYAYDSAVARFQQTQLSTRKLDEDIKVKMLGEQEAAQQLATAELNLSYCEIRATIDGHITKRTLEVGQRATMGEAAYEIEDLDALVIEPTVPEKELSLLRLGLDATLTSTAFPGATFRGELEYIARRVEVEGGKVQTRIRLADDTEGRKLLPGMFVSGHLVTREKPNILLIPKKALLFDRDRAYVYAADDDEGQRIVRKVYIQRGLEDATRVEYLPIPGRPSELDENSQIVVVGIDRLVDGSAIRVEGETIVTPDEPGSDSQVTSGEPTVDEKNDAKDD